MAFPFLALFLAFILFLFFRHRSVTKSYQEREDSFWEKERLAGFSAGGDPDTFPYVEPACERFLAAGCESLEIADFSERLNRFSTMKMMKIWDLSNTDIKLTYGTKNFDFVAGCGEVFNEYTGFITECAEALMQQEKDDEAISLLEYGLAIGSDRSKNYMLLADLYAKKQAQGKLEMLKELTAKAPEVMQKRIISYIEEKGV